MATIPFVGPSYDLKRRKASVQRCINLMPTPIESGSGKAPSYLAPVPGLVPFVGNIIPVTPPAPGCWERTEIYNEPNIWSCFFEVLRVTVNGVEEVWITYDHTIR